MIEQGFTSILSVTYYKAVLMHEFTFDYGFVGSNSMWNSISATGI